MDLFNRNSKKNYVTQIMEKFQFIGVEINIYGLSYECPYVIGKSNCPLKCVDSLSFQEKVNWINDLSEEIKRSIWEQHIACSHIRNSESCSVIMNE